MNQNEINNNRTKIKIDELFTRIDVLPPYFALKDLEIDTKNSVFATIAKEQSMGNEIGMISGAEVGRHLAILGSCSLAYLNISNEKHYYLAYEATIKMIDKKSYSYAINNNQISTLLGTAKGEFISKKLAQAECSILNNDGELLYTLDVKYKVIPEAIFLRMNAKNKIKKEYYDINPYTNPLDFKNKRIEDNIFKASIGSVEPNWCIGHFAEIPALPVAHLMYNITECMSQYLRFDSLMKDINFYLNTSTIWADNLAFTGEIINFECKLLECIEENYHFICNAITSNNKVIGRTDSWVHVLG